MTCRGSTLIGRRSLTLAILLGSVGGAASAARPDDWAQFARGPDRVAASEGVATGPALGVRWLRSVDSAGAPIAFVGQAGVVLDAARVYAVGRVGTQYKAFGIRRGDGGIDWASPVASPMLDSWSAPAVDAANGTVIIASARLLTAFDAGNGAIRWQAMLDRVVVDASPLITTDRGPADRVFITDYHGFGGAAKLYCINADAFDAVINPYQPGQIVWAAPIGGASGNTPAYHAGVVYVASVSDESGVSGGRILAFDAGAVSAPAPMWVFESPGAAGFFGGVSCRSGSVYAASYALSGGLTNSNLVKVNAADGWLVWAVPCNRTDATPIPLAGGLIVLSGGIQGFGSAPSVELFRDDGASATMLWDSAQATWHDDNANATLDPGEYLPLGGWSHQPAAVVSGGMTHLVVGVIPTGTTSFGACTDAYILDLSQNPAAAGFIVEHCAGMGSTPAIADGGVYTAGAAGLYALGAAPPLPCYANCDASTTTPLLNVLDFGCFLNQFAAGDSYANCDGSTTTPVLNVLDFGCFLNRFAAGCS